MKLPWGGMRKGGRHIMDINFSVLLPLLLLALGVFLVLKTNQPVWKIIGWVLVVIIALLFVLVSRVSS